LLQARALTPRGWLCTPWTLHQHDAPGTGSASDSLLATYGLDGRVSNPALDDAVVARFESAARAATASGGIAVAKVGAGAAKVDRVASNRRILGPDGKVALQRQSAGATDPKAAAAPEGTIDPFLRVLGFWGMDGQPIACVSNYATHPMSFYGKGQVNWDFIGIARQQQENHLGTGVACLHFNGAGGNVAAGKYNDGKLERRNELAARVSAAMKAAWAAASGNQRSMNAENTEWITHPVSLPLSAALRDDAAVLGIVEDTTLPDQDRLAAARDLT
jgi:hypothetical protein